MVSADGLTVVSVDSLTLPCMREISVVEQRYQAILAVLSEGRTVKEVVCNRAGDGRYVRPNVTQS